MVLGWIYFVPARLTIRWEFGRIMDCRVLLITDEYTKEKIHEFLIHNAKAGFERRIKWKNEIGNPY